MELHAGNKNPDIRCTSFSHHGVDRISSPKSLDLDAGYFFLCHDSCDDRRLFIRYDVWFGSVAGTGLAGALGSAGIFFMVDFVRIITSIYSISADRQGVVTTGILPEKYWRGNGDSRGKTDTDSYPV